MGVPGALRCRQLSLVRLVEVEDVELLVPVVGLALLVLVPERCVGLLAGVRVSVGGLGSRAFWAQV